MPNLPSLKNGNSRYYGASIDAGYYITSNAKIFAEFAYGKYEEGKGGTQIAKIKPAVIRVILVAIPAGGITNNNYTVYAKGCSIASRPHQHVIGHNRPMTTFAEHVSVILHRGNKSNMKGNRSKGYAAEEISRVSMVSPAESNLRHRRRRARYIPFN